jgi:hypothetical protein
MRVFQDPAVYDSYSACYGYSIADITYTFTVTVEALQVCPQELGPYEGRSD